MEITLYLGDIGQLVEGTITRLTKFGAFARLDNEIEGLIHISEISENRIEHPREVLKDGEKVTLRIVRIDPDQRRIGLSLRKVDSPAYADKDMKVLAKELEFGLDDGEKTVDEEPTDEESAEESIEEAITEESAVEEAVDESAEEPVEKATEASADEATEE